MRKQIRWLHRLPERPEVWKTASILKLDRRIIACAVMALAEYLDSIDASSVWFGGIDEKIVDKVADVAGFFNAALEGGLILKEPESHLITLAFWADITSNIEKEIEEEVYTKAAIKRAKERDRKRAYRDSLNSKNVDTQTLSRVCPAFVPGTNGGQMDGTCPGTTTGQSVEQTIQQAELELNHQPEEKLTSEHCPVFVPSLSQDKKEKESFPQTPFKEKEKFLATQQRIPARIHTYTHEEDTQISNRANPVVWNVGGMVKILIKHYPKKGAPHKVERIIYGVIMRFAEENNVGLPEAFKSILYAVIAYAYHVRQWANPQLAKSPEKWFEDGEYLLTEKDWEAWFPRIQGRMWTLNPEDINEIHKQAEEVFKNGLESIKYTNG